MAQNKKSLFSNRQLDLAEFARCLSHPARIAIVTHLQEKGQATCGQIVEELPLAQATISQHLTVLRHGGLVIARACGPSICYSLNAERIRTFCAAFQEALGKTPAEPEPDPTAHCAS